MTVDIVVNSKNAEDKVERLDQILSGPGLEQLFGDYVQRWFNSRTYERFLHEGDDAAGAWTPLRSATLVRRRDQGYGPGPINYRTGEMMRWATESDTESIGSGAGDVLIRYPGDVPTGELKEKVKRAQGFDPNVEARPILAVNETDLARVMERLGDGIEAMMR